MPHEKLKSKSAKKCYGKQDVKPRTFPKAPGGTDFPTLSHEIVQV